MSQPYDPLSTKALHTERLNTDDPMQIDLIEEEKLNYRGQKKYQRVRWIIFPDDKLRTLWDMVMIFVLVCVTLITPFSIAFHDATNNNNALEIEMAIIDVIFGIDIVLLFFMAYIDKNHKLVVEHHQVAKHYLYGWFIIDFLAILSFNALFGIYTPYNKLLRLLRLGRLRKLLKYNRISQELKNFNENVQPRFKWFWTIVGKLRPSSYTQSLLKYFMAIFIFIHIVACFICLLTRFEGEVNWITQNKLKGESNQMIYSSALYLVTQTVVTVGYGDVQIVNSQEMVICSLLMFYGVFFYSYTVGNVTALIQDQSNDLQHLLRRQNTFSQMRDKYNLDDALYFSVNNILQNQLNDDKPQKLLKELPSSYRIPMAWYMYKDMLEGVTLFEQCTDRRRFISVIGPLLKEQRIKKGQYVYQAQDYSSEMYFIKSGHVSLVLSQFQDHPYMQFKQGQYFGESDIFKNINRQTTVLAIQDSVLLSLNRKHFQKVFFQKFRLIGQDLIMESEAKLQVIQEKQKLAVNLCLKQEQQEGQFQISRRKSLITKNLSKLKFVQRENQSTVVAQPSPELEPTPETPIQEMQRTIKSIDSKFKKMFTMYEKLNLNSIVRKYKKNQQLFEKRASTISLNKVDFDLQHLR